MNCPILRIFMVMIFFSGTFGAAAPVMAEDESYTMLDCSQVTDIPPDECQALLDFYESTHGDGWTTAEKCAEDATVCWFETNTADEWDGVTVIGGTVISIVLDNHELSGAIPESISDLPNLDEMCLLNNAVGGALPDSLGELAYLQKLSLSYNDFTGEIPAAFGNIASLRKLSLGSNALEGSLPEELGNLLLLERLDVNSNNLVGELPDSLGQLTHLTDLILFGNGFTGLVPSSFVGLESLYYFYFFGTDLCERTDPAFLAWKATVEEWQGTGCVCRIYFPIIFR